MPVIWIGDATSLCFQLLFRLTRKYYILVGLDIYNLSANYNGRKHWSMKARNLWSFWSTLGRERSTTSTKSCSLSSVPNEWQLHLSLEMCRFTCCQVWELLNCECTWVFNLFLRVKLSKFYSYLYFRKRMLLQDEGDDI